MKDLLGNVVVKVEIKSLKRFERFRLLFRFDIRGKGISNRVLCAYWLSSPLQVTVWRSIWHTVGGS